MNRDFVVKKKCLLILPLLGLMLYGCFGNSNSAVFNAVVLENTNSSILVEPEEGSNELKIADKISISLKNCKIIDSDGSTIASNDLKSGDEVEVRYEGAIAESYPAQINKCYMIKRLKKLN